MDNLTHSLTGALAAKAMEVTKPEFFADPGFKRKAFWLLVVSANLPDLDVALGAFQDPIFAMQHHRGLTHSLVFAPVFALAPAALFYFWKKLAPFQTAWLLALLGTLLHIFFDVITAYGTQILAPLSSSRYALDWMFIIDPWFTGLLAAVLLLARLRPANRRRIVLAGSVLVLFYLGAEMINHQIARHRMAKALQQAGVQATKITALPQPLSLFRWMGLAQTADGARQAYMSNRRPAEPLTLTVYENAQDEFAARALQIPESRWYLHFARFPWVHSEQRDGRRVVEIRDLQFMIDRGVLRAIGFAERSLPFILRYTFSARGDLSEMKFNEEPVPRPVLSK
ncbi:MAG: metal-dependent hydrolase [candidate division KSB1 bacterium]|nr:metal-dependent hydrolase [candidate division KSB1 bacterium]MDZ7272705.1 metal-dependent hydrolase [candidate division KSB1 bacterium]MDZ7284272.1 metal-dependent hydrolase [candidate division KSB1 bacterium]MDZ7297332.1 metal-dependent hydrolase [candidate division KSB1 bacterium]MDZ7348199.1 metal-dependent hydrolase [candidate division KSB1 bacterium]